MLKIAIVEDDRLTIQQYEKFIQQYAKEHKQEIEVISFLNGKEILKEYEAIYDIILMDIEMPQINGMETAEKIRQLDSDVVIMFITNMAQFAIKGYMVGALDFVLKPVDYYTFSLKLERAISRVKKRESGKIILNLLDGTKWLETKHIYYVEIQNRMLHYHTLEGEYMVRGTMQSAEELLKEYHFVKCNYWYLVNLRHVTEIRKNIVVVHEDELEISRRNKNAFITAVMSYMGGNS